MDEPERRAIQGLIDAIPFHVLLVDQQHRIIAANRTARELLGPSLVPSGTCRTLLHGQLEQCPLEEAERTGHEVEREVRLDGRWLRLSVFLTELVSDEGSRIYLQSLRDITTMRRADEERALLAEQLMRAQKLDGIGRLAGGIAHDFNNLLTLILNYAAFIAREVDEGSPVREDVERIRSAGKRAAALTRQLLAFSRREIVEVRVLDLNEIVADVEKLLRRTIGEHIKLVADLDPSTWRVRADAGQLEQVLLNLALNARDAMPQGGRLTVRTAQAAISPEQARPLGLSAGRYAQLQVTDTGVGMEPAVKAHIFEPFFTTKERGKGTGLGLSTVYGIVTGAGGAVHVESEEGSGTTFTIYLPATLEAKGQQEAVAEVSGAAARGETVLVVDDDGAVRDLLVRILRDAGYDVLEASEGAAALRAAQRHPRPIQLLIADVVLQGMTGKQVADSIGRLHPEVRVLYMSGYPDDDVVQRGVVAVGLAFLPKPFTDRQLLCKVREALDRRRDVGWEI
jgi:two-component system, cell cycle sensor histidine kinase and response regulator CckA